MPDGFKLLDAYVEVTTDTSKVGTDIAKGIERAAPEVSAATKKLTDAVVSASDNMTSARMRQLNAAGSLRIAEMRLAETMKTAEEGSVQLAAAQERVASAQRASEAAMSGTARAATKLAEAEKAAGKASQENNKEASSAGSGIGSSLMYGLQNVVGSMIGNIVGQLFSPIVQGAQTAITAIGSAVKQAAFDYNSTLEQANIGFTTMLGSAEKAKNFIGELQNFAKVTPFEFKDLETYSQQMIGYGINVKNVIPDLTALGDAAAGAGKSGAQLGSGVLAFEQMAARGKVDLGDLDQMTNAGIPAVQILANAYHTTAGNLMANVSASKVMASEALPLLIKGIEHGTKTTAAYGGMMTKQSETMQGALGNISDAFNQTVSTAMLPFFKVIEKGALALANWAGSNSMMKWAQSAAKSIGDFVGTVSGMVKDLFQDPQVKKSMADFGSGLSKGFKDAQGPLKTILPNLVQFGKEVLPTIISGFGKVAAQIPTAIKVMADFVKLLKDNGPGIAAFIGMVVNIGVAAWQVSAAVWDAVAKIGSAFSGLTNGITQVFSGAIGWLFGAGFNIVSGLINGMTSIGAEAIRVAGNIGQSIIDAMSGVAMHSSAAPTLAAVSNGDTSSMNAAKHALVSGIDSVRNHAVMHAGSVMPHIISAMAGGGPSLANLGGPKTSKGKAGSSGSGGASAGPTGPSLAAIKKTFHHVAQQVSEGLHAGLLGSVSQIKVTSGHLMDAITGGFNTTTMSKSQENRAIATISKGTKDLLKSAAQRDTAIVALKSAQAKLKVLLADEAKMATAVAAKEMAGANVTSIFTATTSKAATAGMLDGHSYTGSWTTTGGAGKLAGVRAALAKLLANTKKFASNLKQLVKMGIDPATYADLVNAGVAGGLDVSTAMVQDPAGLRAIIGLERQITGAATDLGTQTSRQTYGARVTAAQKTVAHDQSVVNHYEVTMVVEANKIDEVQKMLKTLHAVKHTAKAAKTRRR